LIPAGEYWENPDVASYDHFYARSFYDLGFFIVCCVIMIAIVTGVIIDAFGASRDHRTEVEEDQAAKCFICGIEGSRFETKRPKDKNDKRHYGFDWHLEHEHNTWNYVYFQAHLKLKNPNDYNGSESYVAGLTKKALTDFFPSERALMLERT
jgi:inositol 1,4,5-triphosphate receptor type 1/inositol 1,4,5-triphosphate receptor type 3